MHESRTTRRGALARLAGVLLAGAAGNWSQPLAAEDRAGQWSSEEIGLQRRGDLSKPPIVTALAIHPGGRLLALAGDDHGIRLWDLGQQRETAHLQGHGDWVRALDFSPDGRLLASAGSDGRVIVWDAGSGAKLHEHDGDRPWNQLAFNQRGDRVISIGFRTEMRVVDALTGRELVTFGCPCVDMRALAISPDDRHLAAGGRNGKIRIWDLESGQVLTEFVAHQQRLRALEFSPRGDRLASCGEDRAVRIWHLSGQLDYELPTSDAKVMALAYCGEDQLATGGTDNLVRIWGLSVRQDLVRLAGHTGSIAALAYAGEILVSTAFDSTVRVWRRTPNVAGDQPQLPGQVGIRSDIDKIAR
jgi:WD40 repeat protein